MSNLRPRTIVVSEIVQLLLLCEPLWRAVQMGSVISLIGTLIICLIAATVVLMATRRKKLWARQLLALLALGGLIMAVVSGDLFAIDQLDRIVAAATSIPLAIAVSFLFTPTADRWFYGVGRSPVNTGNDSWLRNWLNKVDIGVRPRNVFEGTEVNLYAFTRRGLEWMEQNIGQFNKPVWSERERCLMLSTDDCSPARFLSIIGMLRLAGLKVRFYGRLKNWNDKLVNAGD